MCEMQFEVKRKDHYFFIEVLSKSSFVDGIELVTNQPIFSGREVNFGRAGGSPFGHGGGYFGHHGNNDATHTRRETMAVCHGDIVSKR